MNRMSWPAWLLLLLLYTVSCTQYSRNNDQAIIALHYTEDHTPNYNELIAHYQTLDAYSRKAKLLEAGLTDAGKPLHLFVMAEGGDFSPEANREKGKTILFINNGIHPGEPCGIDASLRFADELLRNVDGMQQMLKELTICIVPVYNVGGHLNRSAYHRANPVGPTEAGFRGNARNLDLNRDFIKCDSENARSFNALFTAWNPDVFLDTHTTNGSDHQYCITLIPTNPAALPQAMGEFLREKMLPSLYEGMRTTPYEMTPYVTWSNEHPGEGITMTFESPRYSTGYSRLHHCYGFMTENHVYKTYTERVESAYHFIKLLADFSASNAAEIRETRQVAIDSAMKAKVFALEYEVDTTRFEWITFKGFKAGTYKSPVTGLDRFGYDRNQPFETQIPYYSTYRPVNQIEKPAYYVVPSAWGEALERLKLNGVEMQQFPADTSLLVDAYFITHASHPNRPYNGHFFHSEVEVELKTTEVQIFACDYLVPTHQAKVAYIVECLEPHALDSYFRWNFFDEIFDRREYFSSWGFEANAQKYLDDHPEFKAQWEAERQKNPELVGNHSAQMQYIYSHTEWSEQSYLRYPVYRLNHAGFKWLKNDEIKKQ
ncbi:MAG: hypothetical protein JXR22_03400 [Prolixibacteraceae bacterium]|nr:hypothetical protein [Prolixibacteraceae bacterium]